MRCDMPDNYINIGSVKACFFVRVSLFLVRELGKKPMLYFSVEEAIKCASMGYYGIGILAFSQLLNVFNRRTPSARHMVAHEFLVARPSKEVFDEVVEAVKEAAREQSEREQKRYPNASSYQETVLREWHSLVARLHGINEEESANRFAGTAP